MNVRDRIKRRAQRAYNKPHIIARPNSRNPAILDLFDMANGGQVVARKMLPGEREMTDVIVHYRKCAKKLHRDEI